MKRILILTHEFAPFHGGVASYAYNLAKTASELDYKVTVVAPNYHKRSIENDKSDKLRIYRFNGGHYNRSEIVNTIFRTYKYIYKQDYDIIHAIDIAHTISLSFINHFKKVKFISTVYGTDILGVNNLRQTRLLGLDQLYKYPEKILAISEFTKQLLIDKCKYVSHEKVITTLLGVSTFWFQKSTEIKHHNIDLKKKIILTVSRIDERKGHRTILKALFNIKSELKNQIQYVIVGDGDDENYKNELKQLAVLSGADVVFLGNISDVELRKLYSIAYIFCMPGDPHPKKVEGFGLVYLEAAAQGLPSIGSKIGATSEVIVNGETGILINPGDYETLASTFEHLITNPQIVKKFGENALKYAMNFNWEKCVHQSYS